MSHFPHENDMDYVIHGFHRPHMVTKLTRQGLVGIIMSYSTLVSMLPLTD